MGSADRREMINMYELTGPVADVSPLDGSDPGSVHENLHRFTQGPVLIGPLPDLLSLRSRRDAQNPKSGPRECAELSFHLFLFASELLEDSEILERRDISGDGAAGGNLAQQTAHDFAGSGFR